MMIGSMVPLTFMDRERPKYERAVVEPMWRIPAAVLSDAEEIKRLRAENDRLRDLLRRARDSRAPDYVGGGWTEAVDEVLKP